MNEQGRGLESKGRLAAGPWDGSHPLNYETSDPSGDSARGASSAPVSGRYRMYAATLDGETCAACAALAGNEYLEGDLEAGIPNPRCTGDRGCRCRWL